MFSYHFLKFLILSIVIFKLSIINKNTFEIAEKELYKIELKSNTLNMEKENYKSEKNSIFQEIKGDTTTVRLSK